MRHLPFFELRLLSCIFRTHFSHTLPRYFSGFSHLAYFHKNFH